MKNFLQVNRASTGAKKNFNFKFKHLLVLSAVLLLGSTQVWGTDYTTVFETDFSDWSAATYTKDENGTVANGVAFNVCASCNRTIKVNENSTGRLKFGGNMAWGDAEIGIAVTLNTKCKVTVTHTSNSSSYSLRYILANADGTYQYSLTGVKSSKDNHTPNSWSLTKNATVDVLEFTGLAAGNYVLHLGPAGSNTQDVIEKIKIETDAAASCTSITPAFSTDYESTTLIVGAGNSSTPTINKDGSSGAITWTSSNPSVATVNSSGVVTPVAAGSARITATVAANGDYCSGSVYRDFTIAANPLGTHTITWTMNVGTSASTTLASSVASTSTYITATQEPNVGSSSTTSGSGANDRTIKVTGDNVGDSRGTNSYVEFAFSIADGYQFTPSAVSVKVANVTTAKKYDLVLSDGSGSDEYTFTSSGTDGSVESASWSGITGLVLTGNCKLRVYGYYGSGTDGHRFGTPITITGTVAAASSCSATANAGADKSTTYNTGVSMAATAASSGYTGAWSIKTGSPSTSTSQLSSTSAYNATFTPNSVGTYTLIWTVTDNSDGSCSASDEATVTVSKANISPSLSYESTTLIVGDDSSSPTVSGNSGSGSVSYAVTASSPSGCISVNTSTGVVTANAAGTGTVTATVAATTNYNGNTCTADFTVNDPPVADHVSISGEWAAFVGYPISITATPYDDEDNAIDPTGMSYQWYKDGTADGNMIDGETSATLNIASATTDDYGSYYCKISKDGYTDVFSSAFGIKIMRIHLMWQDGTEVSDYAFHNFAPIGGSKAVCTIALEGYNYSLQVLDGQYGWGDHNNAWFGRSNYWGTTANPWAHDVVDNKTYLNCDIAGDYVFTLDYSNGYKLGVMYPQPTYYYKGNDDDWSSTHEMTKSCDGTYAYFWTKGATSLQAAGRKTNNNHFLIMNAAGNSTIADGNKLEIRDGEATGFGGTDIWGSSNMGKWDGSSSNASIYNAGDFYIVVFYPNNSINTTNDPKICASTKLPGNATTADEVVYFEKPASNWGDKAYYRIGHRGTSSAPEMELVPGTARLYQHVLSEWTGYEAWSIANNSSWQGSNNSIYKVNTGDTYAVTKSTNYFKCETDGNITIILDDANNTADGCTYYNVNTYSGMLTHTATVGSTTNGSIQLDWTDTDGDEQTATSTTSGLAHTCNLTVTGVPATGYDVATLTVDGDDFTSGETHVLTDDATIAATFALHNYNVTYSTPSNGNYTISVAGGSATSATKTATYGQTITLAASANTGYSFTSWTVTKEGGGTVTVTSNQFMMPADNVTITATFTAIPVSSISVSPSSQTLDVDNTQTLTATVNPSNALDKTVTWSSSNSSVASVNSSGVVTAKAPGTATITATAHDGSLVTGTCSITVNKIQPTKYSFSVDKTTLCGEETATLTLENSDDGVTYELRSDATHSIADTQKSGTGSAISWEDLGAGSYVVYAVENATYAERQMNGSKITVSTGTTTSITTGPTSVLDAVVGSATSLSVTAAGTDLSYQWKQCATVDGTYANVASGGTSATYNVTPAAAGTIYYKVVVTGTCGEVTSSAVSIVATAPVLYTVTFDANGGTIDDKDDADVTQESVGGEITLLTPDARSGYIFEGWEDKDENLIGDAGNGYTPTANITLYAKWTELSSKCKEMNKAFADALEVSTTQDGVTYDIEWLDLDDENGLNIGTYESDELYAHMDISSLGFIKEVKLTITEVGATVANKGIYYEFSAARSNSVSSATAIDNLTTGDLSIRPTSGDHTSFKIVSYNTNVKISDICIYYEVPCFMMKANTSAGDNGSLDHNESISVGSDNCISLIGGTAKYVNSTGSGTMDVTYNKGWYFNSNNDQIVVTLAEGSFLQSGSVITVAGNAEGNNRGFKVNGVTVFTATGSGNFSGETYTVTGSDTELLNARELTITRSSGNGLRLSSIYVTNCGSCTPISPSLDYSKKSFWMEDATLTATPTLTGNTGGGTVTYSSSNTDAVTVVESGVGAGTITAVGRGTATITASIAKNGGYCDAEVTCDITVKDINCGELPIASATRKSGSGNAMENGAGAAYSAAGYSGQTDGKLGSDGNYMYITLTGTYLRDGDVVVINIAKKNTGGIYLYKGTTSAGTAIGSIDASAVKEGDNEITLSGVPDNTSSVTMCRVESNQNHKVDGIAVKRYSCPDSKEFLPTGDDGNWNATANWIGATGRGASLPTIDDRVIISKPVTVDIADAKAQGVLINQYSGATGKVTVSAGKALIIADKLQKTTTGSNRIATAAADVIINSTRAAGVGALIIGGETGTNKATVNFETKAKNDGGWVNQFIGSPFSDNKPYVDYALQLYKFVPRANGDRGWWSTVHEGDEMEEFWGYNVLYNDASELDVTWTGTLNASESKTISGLYYNGSSETDNMFANSWTAPIHVGAIEDADLPYASKTLYMFNAGTPAQEEGQNGSNAAYNNTSPGTYISIPIHSAPYAGIGVIPSMQAFYVEAQAAEASITLDYNKVVYTPALTSVGIVPNRAPKRGAEVEEPEVIKLHVQSETGWGANTYVLSRADFAEGYEDGWDGAYIEGESATPKLYTPSIDGDMFINCLPQIDGTVVGFRRGSDDSAYTFSFKYDGEDEYYLKDLKLDIETRIDNDHTYFFTTEDGDSATRFIIVRKTPAVATGSDNVDAEAAQARKLIIDNKVYIIRGGRMYNATGALVK